MKVLLRVLGLVAALIIGFGVYVVNTPWLLTRAQVTGQVWGLNLGIIKVKDADWGFLKLRSGPDGLAALRDLERHGASDDIRRTSVAVQEQWYDKGDHFGGPEFGNGPHHQDHETRLGDLRLPHDGKALHQDLKVGEMIPDSFWQAQRYRIGCLFPPPALGGTRECNLQLADVNGDGIKEIILDQRYTGTRGDYKQPVVQEMWYIYRKSGTDWVRQQRLRFCGVDQAASGDTRARLSSQSTNKLWLNGQAVNFFNGDCYGERAFNVAAEATMASSGADKLQDIKVVDSVAKLPANLAEDVRKQTVIQPSEVGPEEIGAKESAQFRALPVCFIKRDPKACVAIVNDFDGDGRDDVVIVDGYVYPDRINYRLATLLTYTGQHWQVTDDHAICADDVPDIDHVKAEVKPAKWLPIIFDHRPYMLVERPDECTYHFSLID